MKKLLVAIALLIVTCEDEQLRRGRLMLAAAVGQTLRQGLGLLGIETRERI